jgi:hypothetical protein
MSKPKLQWIVTANFTSDGAVAYLGSDQSFGRVVTDALVFETKEEAEAARQIALGAEQVVSDPYLTEVARGPQGGLDVLTARERIRSQGPTVTYGLATGPGKTRRADASESRH